MTDAHPHAQAVRLPPAAIAGLLSRTVVPIDADVGTLHARCVGREASGDTAEGLYLLSDLSRAPTRPVPQPRSTPLKEPLS